MYTFGPTSPSAFAWWAGVPARVELAGQDAAGQDAWILAIDETALRSTEPMRGIRLLVARDLRMFGQDRIRPFVGPGRRDHSSLQDWHHPNGLLVSGHIAGAWDRRAVSVTEQ